jgi:hypothetical protein
MKELSIFMWATSSHAQDQLFSTARKVGKRAIAVEINLLNIWQKTPVPAELPSVGPARDFKGVAGLILGVYPGIFSHIFIGYPTMLKELQI